MADTMDESHDDTAPLLGTETEDNDITIEAEKPTKKNDFIEAEMTDFNICYGMPYLKGHRNSDDYKCHIHLLISLTTAFDNSTMHIYDNKNNRVKSFTEPKWLDQEYYEEHFRLHDDEQQRKTVIVHRVKFTLTISAMKKRSNRHHSP